MGRAPHRFTVHIIVLRRRQRGQHIRHTVILATNPDQGRTRTPSTHRNCHLSSSLVSTRKHLCRSTGFNHTRSLISGLWPCLIQLSIRSPRHRRTRTPIAPSLRLHIQTPCSTLRTLSSSCSLWFTPRGFSIISMIVCIGATEYLKLNTTTFTHGKSSLLKRLSTKPDQHARSPLPTPPH